MKELRSPEQDHKRKLLDALKRLPELTSILDYASPPKLQQKEHERRQLISQYEDDTHKPKNLLVELANQWPDIEAVINATLSELLAIKRSDTELEKRIAKEIPINNSNSIIKVSLTRLIKENTSLFKDNESFTLTLCVSSPNTFPLPETKSNLPNSSSSPDDTNILLPGEVVKRSVRFKKYPNSIVIDSVVLSRDGLQGEFPEAVGISTFLMRVSHRINRLLSNPLNGIFNAKLVSATITDISTTGWSGKRAKELGYAYEPHRPRGVVGYAPEEKKIWKYEYK